MSGTTRSWWACSGRRPRPASEEKNERGVRGGRGRDVFFRFLLGGEKERESGVGDECVDGAGAIRTFVRACVRGCPKETQGGGCKKKTRGGRQIFFWGVDSVSLPRPFFSSLSQRAACSPIPRPMVPSTARSGASLIRTRPAVRVVGVTRPAVRVAAGGGPAPPAPPAPSQPDPPSSSSSSVLSRLDPAAGMAAPPPLRVLRPPPPGTKKPLEPHFWGKVSVLALAVRSLFSERERERTRTHHSTAVVSSHPPRPPPPSLSLSPSCSVRPHLRAGHRLRRRPGPGPGGGRAPVGD
jgi:hypothetical protein